MPTLSVALIVKNEEAHLPHCLASIKDLADQIVVVDTGSSDRTVEIAREFGVEVGYFEWVDDFAAARNHSLSLCTGDWILVLDADEAIDPTDHPAIRSLLKEDGPQAYRLRSRSYLLAASQTTLDSAPTLNTSHYTEGRSYTHYTDFYTLRLCRNLPGLRFTGKIHELLEPCLLAKGVEVKNIDPVIHHYGKTLIDREIYKQSFYLKLTQEEVDRDPSNHQAQFNLMMQAMVAGEWSTCLKAGLEYTKLRDDAPYLVFLGLGIAYQHLADPVKSLFWLDQLLATAPTHAVALTHKAQNLASMGNVEGAAYWLEKAIDAQPGFTTPYLVLADLHSKRGMIHEVKAVLRSGLASNPTEESLWTALINQDLESGSMDQAVLSAWEAIQKVPNGGNGEWHRLVANSLRKEGKNEMAERVMRMKQASDNDVG